MFAPIRPIKWFPPVVILAIALLGGCGLHWDSSKAPDGFGIIREHVLLAPPDMGGLDFTIVKVDGESPTREHLPFWVDMDPGVQVSAGPHRIVARVAPHRRPQNYEPREISFEVTLGSGKAYNLVDDGQGRPVLVACHSVSR